MNNIEVMYKNKIYIIYRKQAIYNKLDFCFIFSHAPTFTVISNNLEIQLLTL